MIIDTERIAGIIASSTYIELMDLADVSKSTATKWKTGELDWRKSKFEAIELLVSNFAKSKNKKRFEEDIEKYGKSVAYDDAVSEIYANLPEELEIGDTQYFLLSGAQENGNSVEFEFEIVRLDEDGIPEFEYTGDYTEK